MTAHKDGKDRVKQCFFCKQVIASHGQRCPASFRGRKACIGPFPKTVLFTAPLPTKTADWVDESFYVDRDRGFKIADNYDDNLRMVQGYGFPNT